MSYTSPDGAEDFEPRFQRFRLSSLIPLGILATLVTSICYLLQEEMTPSATAIAMTCMRNEKQLGLAILQYEQDNDERLPLATMPTSWANARSHWVVATTPYLSTGHHAATYPDEFRCPGAEDRDGTPRAPLSYMYNDIAAARRIEDFSIPAATIVLIDGTPASLDFDGHRPALFRRTGLLYGVGHTVSILPWQADGMGSEVSTECDVWRHKRGANMALADGHVH